MRAGIRSTNQEVEHLTDERCYVVELSNDREDEAASITRVRVAPGVTTQLHRLRGIEERYVILSGRGVVEVETMEPCPVSAGDIVRIPTDAAQRISNAAEEDLVFLCICTPRFEWQHYESLE